MTAYYEMLQFREAPGFLHRAEPTANPYIVIGYHFVWLALVAEYNLAG